MDLALLFPLSRVPNVVQDGVTPLGYACRHGALGAIAALLELGAVVPPECTLSKFCPIPGLQSGTVEACTPGVCALWAACHNGDDRAVRCVLTIRAFYDCVVPILTLYPLSHTHTQTHTLSLSHTHTLSLPSLFAVITTLRVVVVTTQTTAVVASRRCDASSHRWHTPSHTSAGSGVPSPRRGRGRAARTRPRRRQ